MPCGSEMISMFEFEPVNIQIILQNADQVIKTTSLINYNYNTVMHSYVKENLKKNDFRIVILHLQQ